MKQIGKIVILLIILVLVIWGVLYFYGSTINLHKNVSNDPAYQNSNNYVNSSSIDHNFEYKYNDLSGFEVRLTPFPGNMYISQLVRNGKDVIYQSTRNNEHISITNIVDLPYLVLLTSPCNECDAPADGSIIINVETKKYLHLPNINVVNINKQRNTFAAQQFVYGSYGPCEALCNERIYAGAFNLPLSKLD
jgi:hypothetical protein